jgi:hypothetical protein
MKLIAGVIATLLNLCFSLFAGLPPDVGEGSFVKIYTSNTELLSQRIPGRPPTQSSTRFTPGTPDTFMTRIFQIKAVKENWIFLVDDGDFRREYGWLNTESIVLVQLLSSEDSYLRLAVGQRQDIWNKLSEEEKRVWKKSFPKIEGDGVTVQYQLDPETKEDKPASATTNQQATSLEESEPKK